MPDFMKTIQLPFGVLCLRKESGDALDKSRRLEIAKVGGFGAISTGNIPHMRARFKNLLTFGPFKEKVNLTACFPATTKAMSPGLHPPRQEAVLTGPCRKRGILTPKRISVHFGVKMVLSIQFLLRKVIRKEPGSDWPSITGTAWIGDREVRCFPLSKG